MKITDIDVIELKADSGRALDLDPTYHCCLVRIMTDAGISGIAEVDSVPSVIRAIVEAPAKTSTLMGLKALLVGEDPGDIRRLWDRMYHHTSYYGRRGVVLHAISAIDMALWDLKGKAEGRPVAELLGPRRHEALPAYVTVYPLGREPDELRRALDRTRAYPARAIKLAIDGFWREERALAQRLLLTAREHLGDEMPIMLDATATFQDAADIQWLLPVLKDCRIDWLEAPFSLDNLAAFEALRDAGIPVAVGDTGLTASAEWEPYFAAGAIDIAQPDIGWVGGFTGMGDVATLCDRHGTRLVPHGWNTDITLCANLHFLATRRTPEYAEFSTSDSPLRWALVKEPRSLESDGTLRVPEGPGLGIDLDDDTLARYRVA